MNLVDGKILDTNECDLVLDTLSERIIQTLSRPRLSAEVVINACDRLISSFDEGFYIQEMVKLGIPEQLGKSYVAEARTMFSGDALRYRMTKEFGSGYDQVSNYSITSEGAKGSEQILPLGVLVHIAAGNADGLPAFSVLEGLLTGNINILKLPAGEGGASVHLLLELIRMEPLLAAYIYVFDYSSKDIVHINRLVEAADGVVVWGGVEAVSAFRTMLPANIKLIEWGHKISFAYVTKQGMQDDAMLYGIAMNIVTTGQLLCSSCQGIFIDTDNMEDVYAFCTHFLQILESVAAEQAGNMDVSVLAQTALQQYTADLEAILTGKRIFKSSHCSLIATDDQVLEPAIGFSNVWVKAVPQTKLLGVLRPYKNYLQTVALACNQDEKPILANVFSKTGVVRICSGARMSATYVGAPHDGEYPLRRYTKVMSIE